MSQLKIFCLIIIVVAIILLLSYIKSRMLYQPTNAIEAKYEKFYHKLNHLVEQRNYVKNFEVASDDADVTLDTIYIRNPDTDMHIIFFHGNAGNISMRYDIIKFLYNYASVIAFDYRSYGKSTGAASMLCSSNLQADAMAIWQFATEQLQIAPNQICLFGESLGCAMAIWLGAELSRTDVGYPHSIVLNGPFYSLSTLITNSFSKFNMGAIGKLVALLVGHEYQNHKQICYINPQTSIVIAHSPRDEVVPYAEAIKLHETASSFHPNAQFVNITGTHNNIGLTDMYIYMLADLLDNDKQKN